MPQVFSAGWLYLFIIVLIICIARIWMKIRTIQREPPLDRPVIRITQVPDGASDPGSKAEEESILNGADRLIKTGELREALEQLERIIENLSPTEDREISGKVLFRIAACHSHLAMGEERFQHLLRAGETLRETVRLFTPERFRDHYLIALDQLAALYQDLAAEKNPVEYLTQRARTLETAAESASGAELAETEARFLFRAGNTYRQLVDLVEPQTNLRKAVSVYERADALLGKSENQDVISDRISILKMLGDTLEILSEYYQKEKSLMRAVKVYETAFNIMDGTLHGKEQMVLKMDISRILLKIHDIGNNPLYLKQVLMLTRNVLEITKIGENPVLRGRTMVVMGDALVRCADIKDRRENLERAVKLYEASLDTIEDGNQTEEQGRIREKLADAVGKIGEIN